MFLVKDKVVCGMALMRFLSSLIEFTAALLFLRFNSIEKALKINAVLALIGPSIMAVVMLMGLAGLAGRISTNRFWIILAGIILVFYGVSKGD